MFVSSTRIPCAKAPDALLCPCRLYALERMVQVLHFNMHRIYDLWGIFLSHVLEVLASAKAALRTAAMDAVGKAITGALDRPVPARELS